MSLVPQSQYSGIIFKIRPGGRILQIFVPARPLFPSGDEKFGGNIPTRLLVISHSTFGYFPSDFHTYANMGAEGCPASASCVHPTDLGLFCP